jgi:hypothetical protein
MHQRVETSVDVIQDLAENRRLRDESDNVHSPAASNEEGGCLVDSEDEPGPRFSAILEPGVFGYRVKGHYPFPIPVTGSPPARFIFMVR